MPRYGYRLLLLLFMSYLQFHLVFIVPPVILLLFLCGKTLVRLGVFRVWGGLALISFLAVTYTTPWDGFLIRQGVWSYGEGRVIGALFGVPLEEYAFFVLQPFLTGLWFLWIWPPRREAPSRKPGSGARWGGALLWLAAGLGCVPALMSEHGRYLGLIVVWAAPVLALQWAIGGGFFSRDRRSLTLGVVVPTVYLWVADRVAIQSGIWHVSGEFTIGMEAFGLPFEEAVFFLVTNVMVVQGILLFMRVSEVFFDKKIELEASRKPDPSGADYGVRFSDSDENLYEEGSVITRCRPSD